MLCASNTSIYILVCKLRTYSDLQCSFSYMANSLFTTKFLFFSIRLFFFTFVRFIFCFFLSDSSGWVRTAKAIYWIQFDSIRFSWYDVRFWKISRFFSFCWLLVSCSILFFQHTYKWAMTKFEWTYLHMWTFMWVSVYANS